MRRVSNSNTLRIGIFGTWHSLWYDKEYYTFLVYKDYKLIEYLNSIFYRLRLPTTHFYLNRINQKYYYIKSNIYLTLPSFNRFTKFINNNKKIFKYLSILEYLFDFNLLIPKNLLHNKEIINNINNLVIKKEDTFFFIYYLKYLFSFKFNLEKINYIFNYNINYFFFLLEENKKIILSDVINNNLNFNSITKLNTKNSITHNKNLFFNFSNFFNINKDTISLENKNNIRYYFINFLSYFLNKKNIIYNNINLQLKNIFSYINNYYLLFINKLLFFYNFIFLKSNNINIVYYYLIKYINKFYFFFNKNRLINLYYLKLENRLVLNNLKKIPLSINNIYKSSFYNYNLRNKKFFNNRYKQYLNYKFNKFFISSLNNRYGFISNYYIKDFNLMYRETNSNFLKIRNNIVDMVHFKKINKFNNFYKRIIFYFKKKFFNFFNFFLESTISNYTGFKTFFLPIYYMKKFPSFDTKLISDYITYNLKRKHKIRRVLKRIGRLQYIANSFSNKIFIPLYNELNSYNNYLYNSNNKVFFNYNNIFNIVFFSQIFDKEIINKYNPISGIRIEFSGPTKKAQMSKTIAYHSIVHDYKLVGKMPTHTIYSDIHYYQSYVKLRRSTLGIKVWLFYNTRITNIHNINKTII